MADLSSITLGQAVDEPSFVDIGISAVSASLELEESSKSMEVLTVDKDLSFIYEVLLLADANQFALKTIRLVDFGAMLRIRDIVKLWNFAVLLQPAFVSYEERTWSSPGTELHKLQEVLAKVSNDDIVLHESICLGLGYFHWVGVS